MKRILLLGIACLSGIMGTHAANDEPGAPPSTSNQKLVLEGQFDFQAGALRQRGLASDEKYVSRQKRHFAFETSAALKATYTYELENLKYGAQLTLTPTTQISTAASFNGSHIFIESDFGKVEVGSPRDAGSQMRITAGDVCAGSGDWSDYAKLDTERMKYKGLATEFASSNGYFVSSYRTELAQLTDGTEFARKISYFTPSYNGFQFGITYIPDTSNVGGTFHDNPKTTAGIKKYKINNTDTMVINNNVKDALAFGATQTYNIKDGVDIAVAATGEFAKSAGKAELIKDFDKPTQSTLAQYPLKGFKTYNLGGILTYGNFSYGLSYGTLLKSLTNAAYNKTGRSTKYYNTGIGYEIAGVKTSLEFFKSEKYKNSLDVITLGTEYKVAPGLLPYAEVSRFSGKGRPSHYPDAPKAKVKGTVVLIGTRLRFKL